MSMAVEEVRGASEWSNAVQEAVRTAANMRRTGNAPAREQWRRLRAVAACALPEPNRKERAATARRASGTPGATGEGGWEGEKATEWERTEKEVREACMQSANALVQTAELWRDEEDAKYLDDEDDEVSEYEATREETAGRSSDEEQDGEEEMAGAREERERTNDVLEALKQAKGADVDVTGS